MQPLPHLPIPSGLWSAPTRMEVKCFLFAAFFLVACVAFSSQDELTDVEGKSKSTLFKIVFSSPFHHSTFIVSTMFSTKKQQQQLTTTIYRAKKSAFTNFILFCINVKIFFPFILWFSPFLFIFKHRHSNKQRTMVNGYSYHHHFVFSMSASSLWEFVFISNYVYVHTSEQDSPWPSFFYLLLLLFFLSFAWT